MKKLLIFIISLFVSQIIYGQGKVEADIKGIGNDKIFVEYIPFSFFNKERNNIEPIRGEIYSVNDRFVYEVPVDEPVYIYFFPLKGEYKRIRGNAYRPSEKYLALLVKPGEKIVIKGILNDKYLDYQASGSEFNEAYSVLRKEFVEKTSESIEIELKLDTAFSKGNKQVKDLLIRRKELMDFALARQLQYIKNNRDKELSASMLIRQPLDTIGKYMSHLTPEIREGLFKDPLNHQYTQFKKFTEVRQAENRIKAGEAAPDFVLKSIKGNSLSLHSLSNKYLVLDFWGSWCGPCISGFPRMKEYYNKYKNQVEFIGIACNDREERWKKSVSDNNLEWLQVINEESADKDVSVKYAVKGYPTKIIIDKEKRIIGKFVGEGDDFYRKLDEVMKQPSMKDRE